jgi:glycosyltransferase involved in cell wall biosynthesis
MKVLHLNLSDGHVSGGTGIAMQRLHQGFNRAGHQSKILCLVKQFQGDDSVNFQRPLVAKAIEQVLRLAERPLALRDSARVISAMTLPAHPLYQAADVVALHCIHEGFLSYLGLPWLTAKPTVFYIHDMWAFTGQCHYSYECDRWKTGCGHCPHLGSLQRDSTHLEWRLKQWAYRHSRLHVITNSTWTQARAEQSLLNRFPVTHLPLGLDTEIYRPHESSPCRTILGLPPDKNILMFGALGLQDFRKGGDLLVAVLRGLPDELKAKTVLVTMGNQDKLPGDVDMPTFHFGFVESDRLKSMLYAAADLFLFPSRHETFGLVSTESMACGTPVVAFRVGGISDAVRPGVTGLLAAPENVDEFRDHVVGLLEDEVRRRRMGQQCREVAVRDYGLDGVIRQHLAVYQQAIASVDCHSPLSQPKPNAAH